ncbi:MAG: hypothetical protein JWM05_2485, partial [Acidimicrobiales bacterium]|nr:hypothetical protein [Acidimicrobiales bacterium]
MKVLVYLLVPILVVAIWSTAMWARNHKPSSLQSGVDDFRREMNALSPDPVPEPRRPNGRPAPGGARPARRGSPPRSA